MRSTFRQAKALATAALLSATSFAGLQAQDASPAGTPPPSLEEQFLNPPSSAAPRVWWHWMNGNVTKDGIRKDLEWMKRAGIGGLQNFDANIDTPQIVDKRLVYMSPEWKDAFRFAVTTADRLGLEFAIASSPGFSETGGPWVPGEDGMKKLVWSEALVVGGKRFLGRLPKPPTKTGVYQSLGPLVPFSGVTAATGAPDVYRDVAVLAMPDRSVQLPQPAFTTADGRAIDPALLGGDDDLAKTIEIASSADRPGSITATFAKPQTVRSLTLYVISGRASPFGGNGFRPVIEASDDGNQWREIARTELDYIPTTVGFSPVTASHFRVTFIPEAAKPGNPQDPRAGVVITPSAFMAASAKDKPVKLAELRFSSEPAVSRSQAKAGFGVVPDYYALLPQADAADPGVDPAQVIDLTARMKADGQLDWSPPKGRWKIIRFGWSLTGTTNHPATKEATGLEVDKYDAAAVRRYLDTYLDTYKDTVGAELMGARGIRALLNDSIESGPANWTPAMIDQFKRLRGYDPTPWLPALTGLIVGTRAQSETFLYDFRRTLADLIASEHYGTIAKVAHECQMIVYGEALEDNRPQIGDDMAMRSHADIPMSAMWTYKRENGPYPTYVADGKGASSVAHIYGRPIVAAESFTANFAPWAYGPGDLRRVANLEFALGINRPVIHTSAHQPADDKVPGLSLSIVGQYFNRHETWAEMARPWMDYLARSSFMLQQGRNVADVAYFHGEEAPLTSLYGGAPVTDAPTDNAYDFMNADALVSATKVNNGRIVTPGGASYVALYLGGSSSRMTLKTLKRIADLVDAGATVVGKAPVGSPSLADDPAVYRSLVERLWGTASAAASKGRVLAETNVSAALRRIGVAPDFTYAKTAPGSSILFVHRRLDDGELYYLANQSGRAETISGRFNVTGRRPEICRADTGRCVAATYQSDDRGTSVQLPFDTDEAYFVVFRKRTEAASFKAPEVTERLALPLSGPWKVAFQPGREAPESIGLDRLASLSTHAEQGVKYFSGVATYTTSFDLPRSFDLKAPTILDLGEVGVVAEVKVNGKPVGTAWHAPYRVDVSGALARGSNQVEIRVANLWVNRLVGDAQPNAKKVTFTTFPTYRPDAPLPPSGLIGPVTLKIAK